MAYVLDATAIRSGMTIAGEGWFTTPGVMDEIRLGRQGRQAELFAELALGIREPSTKSMEAVARAAESTGDMGRLSETDRGIIALALELGATLISDDYSVQNTARFLEIPFLTDMQGIRKIIHWTHRCRGCGRYYDKEQPDCPICGSEVRMVTKR